MHDEPNRPPSGPSRPKLAITVGDVAGVGPELALRCISMPEVVERCCPILYGPAAAIRKIARSLNLTAPGLNGADLNGADLNGADLNGADLKTANVNSPAAICDVGAIDVDSLQAGIVTAETGLASFHAVDRAITDAIAKRVDAIVTGPIQKEAWHAAGILFPGHTELLAERTGIDDFCMMLTSEEISCVLATIHVPLADVAGMLTTESVLRAIRLGAAALSKRTGRAARVTVCGLNPHAGENGMFSHGEEQAVIEPAIRVARSEGIDVVGPISPDTAFTPRVRSRSDVYVCMYHDQGLIPLKALAFDDAVNVTLGLPIIRTSVDHGTAIDLAWKGTANHQSMLAAISMAIDLAQG